MRRIVKAIVPLFVIYFWVTPSLVFAKMSNDPLAQQWGYDHTGVYRAWEYTTGSSNVIVAVIDNGFDDEHTDLKDNVWKNSREIPNNGIDDDQNGYVDDVVGWNFIGDGKGNNNPRPQVSNITDTERFEGVFNHGTLVAGIIGAVGDNGQDGTGINWKVKLMNLRAVENTGSGNVEDVVEAIHYAVDNGAQIINVSVVGTLSEGVNEAIQYAYEHGVAVIAAAGNDHTDLILSPRYPVCSDAGSAVQKVLGVSAVDENHHLATFSNTGAPCIDLAAPGKNIASTIRYAPENGLSQTYSGGWNGTSFAAPFVSGAAALLKSVQPRLSPFEIFDALLKTTQHTGGQDEAVYATLFGSGLLQIDKAIAYALDKKLKSLEKLLVIDPKNGGVQELYMDNTGAAYQRIALQNADDVKRVNTSQGIKFIVATPLNKAQRQIRVYTDKWRTQATWTVQTAGPVNIAVGDLNDEGDPEIVIAPSTASSKLYQVFNFLGELQSEKTVTTPHTGVRIAVVKTADGTREVAVLRKDQNAIVIQRFDRTNRLVDDIDIGAFKALGDFVAGDIDADGIDEYVVVGGASDGPYLAYYEQNGDLKRKFAAFSPHKFTGLDVETLDYNGDDRFEVLVHSRLSTQPLRLWSDKSKKLKEWAVPDAQKIDRMILIPS